MATMPKKPECSGIHPAPAPGRRSKVASPGCKEIPGLPVLPGRKPMPRQGSLPAGRRPTWSRFSSSTVCPLPAEERRFSVSARPTVHKRSGEQEGGRGGKKTTSVWKLEVKQVSGCMECWQSLRPGSFFLSSAISNFHPLEDSVVGSYTVVATSCTVLSPHPGPGSSQKVGHKEALLSRAYPLWFSPWLFRTKLAPVCCSAVN